MKNTKNSYIISFKNDDRLLTTWDIEKKAILNIVFADVGESPAEKFGDPYYM